MSTETDVIENSNKKIILAGGAGLVGQNLLIRLKEKNYNNIVVLDKHIENVAVLRKLHPDVNILCVDVSKKGEWESSLEGADVLVMLQAQIGGNDYSAFERNNISSTKLLLDCMSKYKIKQLVHISSSVVNSVADDFYTNTKKEQECIVLESGFSNVVLRPTLMFGWFDRKHLGWLSRFMKKVPIFPIPGDGKYMRQPLYVGDFCNIIINCIRDPSIKGIYDISGREYVDYIDIIRTIKKSVGSRTFVLCIPYKLFYFLLWLWSLFDKNPPFTTQQLSALTAKDEFDIIDWPSIFSVTATSFDQAIDETFNDPRYSNVALEF